VTGTSGAVSEAVARVEAELAAFWAGAKDETAKTSARAATMNFVVACTLAEVEGLRGAIEELAHTRAGRVFLLTVDPRLAPWDIEPSVSAVCHKEGETVICYDRIELHFGAMAAARAPSVLSALSLSEVPTIVEVQRGAPAPLADGLTRAADRVIVDSAHTPVRRIADIAQKTHAPVADRAFVRTFSWRELIARFFDEAPGAERAIGRVEIERTTADHKDPAALLLGWLASRLGWRFQSAARAIDALGLPVDVSVHGPSAALDPHGLLPTGEIAAVRIVSALENRPLFCTCERRATERIVRWSIEGPRSSAHEHALGFRDEGWVLGKAIDSVEGDRVYREAVLAAAEWARLAEEAK
jgi:hypothetical protein